MCGIAGIIGLNKDYQVNPNLLDKMTDVLFHRGPDDRGVKIVGNVGLGHRRLSIIDLSSAGHQPMSNDDESVWIVFNGEIYNYQRYVVELKSKGYHFKSNSDTELIIHAYKEWGIEGCIERLNGMFAFCLYDVIKEETYLVRDRFGIKPLYYANKNNSVYFGSEIKAILSDKNFRPALDLNTLSHFLTTFYTYAPDSIIKEIKALEPGSYLKIHQGKMDLHQYWDIQLSKDKLDWSESQILEKFDELFDESVKLTLVSDVPVGHLLSSGVDSNAVLYYMAKHESDIHTFTVDTEIDSYSEGAISKDMANYFGTKHHNYLITPWALLNDMDKIIWHQDQLSGNSACIGIYFVFKLLKENGIKVGLLGSGPDEMFAGYETYLADRYAEKLRHPLLRPLIKSLDFGLQFKKASFEFVSTDYKLRKLVEGLYFNPEKSHYWWRSILVDKEKEQLFKSDVLENVRLDSFDIYGKHYNKFSSQDYSFLDRSLYADMKMFLGNNSLMLSDGASMAHSVEARPSMLNHEFVEFAFQLPNWIKISKDKKLKYIMRKSMEGKLPQDFLDLPKRGMNLPLSFWIENELKDFVLETLSDSRTETIGLFNQTYINRLLNDHFLHNQNNMYKIWNLVVFYKWHELMIERKGFE